MILKRKILMISCQIDYYSTKEFNELTVDNFGARLAQINLASKNDIADFVKKKKILTIN